jgi:hypothetical protein
MTVSISQLFDEGVRQLVAEHDAQEGGKVGTLRAGNTGLLTGDGRVVGKCHRLTYLRMKGINVEQIADNRELMFAGGRGNEDLWIDVLERSWPGPILRESEIPISWMTGNGVAVTGRPDIVLCKTDTDTLAAIPQKGIELKLVSSLWTARDVGFQMKPKMLHLLQAAHYSWKLGIPFELWYTSRADFAVGSGWEQKNFPKQGKPGSDRLEYNEKGGVKKVLPFVQGYELEWSDRGGEQDQLKYRMAPSAAVPDGKWTFTLITKKSIQDFYEMVARMGETKDLGPRPLNLDADGQPGGYKVCDYCPLGAKTGNGICDDWEDSWEKWFKAVEKHAATLRDGKIKTKAKG